MKLFYQIITIALLYFNATIVSRCQNYEYELVAPGTNIYQDIQNDIEVTDFGEFGLHILDELNGETFWFYNLPFTFGGYKTLAVGEGAFLRVDNDSSLIIIDAAFTNMEAAYPDSKISYVIEGTSGNYVVKSQYKNFKFTSGEADNFFNVQIWYYQQTGVIEIHYGSRSESNASGFTIANGPNVGIFYSPGDFSGCYEKIWCTGNPNNPYLNTNSNYVFHAMQGLPLEGTIYRFSPLFLISKTNEVNDISFDFFPNPAEEKIKISGPLQNGEITIFNMHGEILRTKKISAQNAEISVSDFTSGIYFVQIKNERGVVTKKLVIE